MIERVCMKISKRKIKAYIMLALEIAAAVIIVVLMFRFAMSATRATVPEETAVQGAVSESQDE